MKEQTEGRRMGGGGSQQAVEAAVIELGRTRDDGQLILGAVQHRPVEIRLRLEVSIQDDAADTCLRGDVLEIGGGKARPGERARSANQDLLPALSAWKEPPLGAAHMR